MMADDKRKIVLICDNASCHAVLPDKQGKPKHGKLHGLDVIDLPKVKIIFLPANTTSKVQPLDAGIIAALKMRYRARDPRRLLGKAEAGVDLSKCRATVKTAIEYTSLIWRQLPKELIQYCWRHVRILPADLHDRLDPSPGEKRRAARNASAPGGSSDAVAAAGRGMAGSGSSSGAAAGGGGGSNAAAAGGSSGEAAAASSGATAGGNGSSTDAAGGANGKAANAANGISAVAAVGGGSNVEAAGDGSGSSGQATVGGSSEAAVAAAAAVVGRSEGVGPTSLDAHAACAALDGPGISPEVRGWLRLQSCGGQQNRSRDTCIKGVPCSHDARDLVVAVQGNTAAAHVGYFCSSLIASLCHLPQTCRRWKR